MKKWMLISWSLLVLYTIYYLIFNDPKTTIFTDLINLDINHMVFAVFNMLGVIPFMMILYIIIFQIKTTKIQKIGLGLSFMTGAFSLYPTAAFLKDSVTKKHLKWTKYASLFCGGMILILTIYGLTLGSVQSYLNAFRNDAFVHIMTIDFFFLYIHSVLASRKVSKKWYISLLPFIGFSYILYE